MDRRKSWWKEPCCLSHLPHKAHTFFTQTIATQPYSGFASSCLCHFSGNMTAHLSSLIHPDRKLFAYAVPRETHEHIEDKLEGMAARSILLTVLA